MKILLITTALVLATVSGANAAFCEKRIQCDSNGCREILDCR